MYVYGGNRDGSDNLAISSCKQLPKVHHTDEFVDGLPIICRFTRTGNRGIHCITKNNTVKPAIYDLCGQRPPSLYHQSSMHE